MSTLDFPIIFATRIACFNNRIDCFTTSWDVGDMVVADGRLALLDGSRLGLYPSDQQHVPFSQRRYLMLIWISKIEKMICKPFRSAGGNYVGYRIEIFGEFGRVSQEGPLKERLLLKVAYAEVERIVDAIEHASEALARQASNQH